MVMIKWMFDEISPLDCHIKYLILFSSNVLRLEISITTDIAFGKEKNEDDKPFSY